MRYFVLLLWASLGLLLSGTLRAQPTKPTATASAGLTGTYYAGRNFDRKKFTRVDPTINFTWRNSPGPGLDWQFYSVRWTGRLFVPTTGLYRFTSVVDDGIRVWVGGRKIIDAWDLHDNVMFQGGIFLIANRYYDVRIDYFNDVLEGEIKLYWTKPNDKPNTGTSLDGPGQLIEPRYLGPQPVRLPVAPSKPVATAPKPTTAPPPITKPTSATTATARRTTPTRPARPIQREPAQPVAATVTTVSPSPVFEQLTAGERVVLKHVFFEQSDYRLLPASYAELDKLVRTMQQQPTLRIEIAGHTDNQGDPRLNLALSENRAKVVANYLIRRGISEDRLDHKGYGGTRALTDNATESARAQNRRVEFIVK